MMPSSRMNILAIGPHPDDIEFGCGGTLIKYAQQNHKVFLLIMTAGGEGGSVDLRMKEQEEANRIIGVEKLFWGGYKDTHLKVNKEVIGKIESVIRKLNPDYIFCNYPEDTHQDHRHATQCVVSATRYIRNVIYFEGPTTQNFQPNIFVSIGDIINRKLEALMAHESQVMKTNIEDMSIVEQAVSTANFRGIQGRVKYAEAFNSLRLFIDI